MALESARPVAPKVCCADPKGFLTSPQGIHGYISVMAALKFTSLFNYRNNVLLKIFVELLSLVICVFCVYIRNLIKEKSCSALLPILLVCICSYLKSFLRYTWCIRKVMRLVLYFFI